MTATITTTRVKHSDAIISLSLKVSGGICSFQKMSANLYLLTLFEVLGLKRYNVEVGLSFLAAVLCMILLLQ